MQKIQIQVGGRLFTQVEQGLRQVEDALSTLNGAAAPVSRSLQYALQRVAQKLAAEHSNPWNGGVVNTSSSLQSRSGNALRRMRDSIKVKGNGSIGSIAGQISTGFGGIHETGGTVRATRSQYLTIPLPAALDPRGVPLRKRARQWDNTFVKRSKRGNLIIFRKTGLREITPLYLLKSEVYIQPRLGMEETILDTGLPYFDQQALNDIETAIMRNLLT